MASAARYTGVTRSCMSAMRADDVDAVEVMKCREA